MADVITDMPGSAGSDPADDPIVEADQPEGPYFLLKDEPIEHGEEDSLSTSGAAAAIASMLESSVKSSPFVLAIDAGWGMGKSTLLHQIEYHLSRNPEIVRLHFNAWTSGGRDTLEGLIKAVLGKLDRNSLRRGMRWLARQRGLLTLARIVSGVAGTFFGVSRMVDDLWSKMNVDAKSRNELRDLIKTMLDDWISQDGSPDLRRALMVFIDDLDRCPDETVVQVCEAVKLYLDRPGMIFVIACDQSVLARSVSDSARGDSSDGRAYLEKIIQVAYRMRPPDNSQVKAFIRACARQSGTATLFDDTVTDILAEGTNRNPRSIKRIINSFVLEYRLDPSWRQPQLGGAQLVTAVLIQHLYPGFYDLLLSEEAGTGLIRGFLDYAQVVEMRPDGPQHSDDPRWETCRRVFGQYRLPLPATVPLPAGQLDTELEKLKKLVPAGFPELTPIASFVRLLRRVDEADATEALHAQLHRRPLSTAPVEASSAKVSYQGVFQWREQTVGDNDKRVLTYQHAVAYLDGVPEPVALCGYQYGPDDLPPPRTAVIWGIGVPKRQRCPGCTAALRKAGYTLWDVDARALGS